MGFSRMSLVACLALAIPALQGPVHAAGLQGEFQLAQAASGTNQPMTEEEKKKLELLKKQQQQGGQKQVPKVQLQPVAPTGKVITNNGNAKAGNGAPAGSNCSTAGNGNKNEAQGNCAIGNNGNKGQALGNPAPSNNGNKFQNGNTGTLESTVPTVPLIKPKTNLKVVPNLTTTQPTGVQPQPPTGNGIGTPKVLTKPILTGTIAAPAVTATLPPVLHLDDIKKGRQEHANDNGQTVIVEPGNRTIIKQGDKIAIQHDDTARWSRLNGAQTEQRPDGNSVTFYVRPDGAKVFSEKDRDGRLLRVYRRGDDGREFSIIDNRRFLAGAAIGAAIGLAVGLELAEPEITIPPDRYIVDYRHASDDDLYEALDSPPLERLERPYSLDEIRYNVALRDRMRRIDLDEITFSTGESDIDPAEYPKLERLAHVLQRILRRHQEEVFLIEGYTDAVGSAIDNLSLSDRRAETVAQVLTETFGVPPENLVTQGYGKQFLKIDTLSAERANRRVAVRRITPLMAQR